MSNQASEALCATCAWAAGCTIPGESDGPIESCRTFYSLEKLSQMNGNNVSHSDPSRAEGLCGDCENRSACMFRKREGGTWHCEEYC